MANPFEDLFDQIGKQDEAHYAAVGRFVTGYATGEAAVHMLARKLSGLSDEKARVIFYKMRLGDLTDRIRAMLRIACLTQINIIADRRHHLVHRSSGFYAGKLIVSNLMTAKSKEGYKLEVFERDEMENMLSDCLKIYMRLIRIAEPSTGDLDDSTMKEILRRPWRYKPKNKAAEKSPFP